MQYVVDLREGFRVFRDGQEAPPAPNVAVCVLLLGLLAQDGESLSRKVVAEQLYPDSDSATALNALRQSVFRLRQWLGAEILESSGDRIRLKPGSFTTDWCPAQANVRIAPHLDHPWADAVRKSKGLTVSSKPAVVEDYIRAIESTARWDRDAARTILISGLVFSERLTSAELSHLLTLTAPTTAREPLAFEHTEQMSRLHYSARDYRTALNYSGRMFRLARHGNDRTRMAYSASLSMCLSIEAGDMVVAGSWLGAARATASPRSGSTIMKVTEAIFLWSSNQLEDALSLMLAIQPEAAHASRQAAVQYWHNLSVLAAEAGRPDLAQSATERLAMLFVPEFCRNDCVLISQANCLMSAGEYDAACQLLRRILESMNGALQRVGQLYATEMYAEALSKLGDKGAALSAWRSVEKMRRDSKIGASPRVQSRRDRVYRTA